MDSVKRKRLEEKGWHVGSTQDFLELSDEEMALIELRIELGKLLKEKRREKGMTQEVFAQEIGTDQARISRMEAGDSSVSMDQIFKCLFHIMPKKEVCGLMAKL